MLWPSAQLSVAERAHLYSLVVVIHPSISHPHTDSMGAVHLPWAGCLGRAENRTRSLPIRSGEPGEGYGVL